MVITAILINSLPALTKLLGFAHTTRTHPYFAFYSFDKEDDNKMEAFTVCQRLKGIAVKNVISKPQKRAKVPLEEKGESKKTRPYTLANSCKQP